MCRYAPCGAYVSVLFFCISDLAALDPMYQYSLPWFVDLFVAAMRAAPPADDVPTRLRHIHDAVTYSLFCNVCRSLFEKDKLLFAFLLTCRVLEARGGVDAAEWLFLLTGGLGDGDAAANPAPAWLTERAWRELCRLSRLPAFAGLTHAVAAEPDAWRPFAEAAAPHAVRLPVSFSALSTFQKLLLVRAVRPDRVTAAVAAFVEGEMGRRYVEPPPLDLAACFADSAPTRPLVFVLSAGSDPTAALLQFAEERGMASRLSAISLGAPAHPCPLHGACGACMPRARAHPAVRCRPGPGPQGGEAHRRGRGVGHVGGAAELPPRAELDASARPPLRRPPPREHAPGLPPVDDVVPEPALPRRRAAGRRQDDERAAAGRARQHAPLPRPRARRRGRLPRGRGAAA